MQKLSTEEHPDLVWRKLVCLFWSISLRATYDLGPTGVLHGDED